MTPPPRRPRLLVVIPAALAALTLSGCAAKVKEIRHHPQEAQLDRIIARITPHTKKPQTHYWVRVSEAGKHPTGLAVYPQRHIYVSELVVDQVDEAVLTAMVAHGVAHHRLRHLKSRGIVTGLQRLVLKAGGFFVPGLSHARHLTGPLTESAMSGGQEPSADRKTVTYLRQMGSTGEEWLRALEFLATHEYAERVGNVTSRVRDFESRIRSLRRHLADNAAPSPAE